MSRVLSIIGAVASLAYLAFLTIFVNGRWQTLVEMPLNNFGDVLAGAFGPLAILWLVLGYFQQGIELRQNSDALRMQAKELSNSVEQQREMVKVARDQYESDRSALEHQMSVFKNEQRQLELASLPMFSFAFGGMHSEKCTHNFYMSNYGQTCTNIHITADDGAIQFSPPLFTLLAKGERQNFQCTLPRNPDFEEKSITISFTDIRGISGQYHYRMFFEKGDSYSTAKLEMVTNHQDSFLKI